MLEHATQNSVRCHIYSIFHLCFILKNRSRHFGSSSELLKALLPNITTRWP